MELSDAVQPTDKSPAIEAFLTSLSGKDRPSTIRAGNCTTCDAVDVPSRLRSTIDRQEYSISGMCQACQDSVFGPMNEGIEDDDLDARYEDRDYRD